MMRRWSITLLSVLFIILLCASVQAQPYPTLDPRVSDIVYLNAPIRVYDTRVNTCQIALAWPPPATECPKGVFTNGHIRYFDLPTGQTPLPFMAPGAVFALHVLDATADGHLTLYDPYPVLTDVEIPIEVTPTTATMLYKSGHNSSSAAATSLGQWQFQQIGVPYRPMMAVRSITGGGTFNLVIDLVGYTQLVP